MLLKNLIPSYKILKKFKVRKKNCLFSTTWKRYWRKKTREMKFIYDFTYPIKIPKNGYGRNPPNKKAHL